ncbi:MAG: hypothetical protein ACYS8W_04395 [Planctomycetota bacterium]|jgi:hypothetical protein
MKDPPDPKKRIPLIWKACTVIGPVLILVAVIIQFSTPSGYADFSVKTYSLSSNSIEAGLMLWPGRWKLLIDRKDSSGEFRGHPIFSLDVGENPLYKNAPLVLLQENSSTVIEFTVKEKEGAHYVIRTPSDFTGQVRFTIKEPVGKWPYWLYKATFDMQEIYIGAGVFIILITIIYFRTRRARLYREEHAKLNEDPQLK